MPHIEDRLDAEALRIIALARYAAWQANHECLSAVHLVHALFTTGVNTVTRAVELTGGRPAAVATICEKLAHTPVPTAIGPGARFLGPKCDSSVRALVRIAEEHRARSQAAKIGTIHLFLGAVRVHADLRTALQESRVNVSAIEQAARQRVRAGRPEPVAADTPANSTSPCPLTEFCTDLTAQAASGRLSPVIGREAEIGRIAITLSRQRKSNALLVGPPGSGKTALVEGLAQRIVTGNVPPQLRGREIFSVDLAAIVAGTQYRGQFEERFRALISAARVRSNCILFIDEAHMIVGAGSASGTTMDAGNLLKPALARGEIHCIAATTDAEYRQHFQKDKALERRFQRIDVEEPTPAATTEILRGLRPVLERHHACTITDDAITAAVEFSGRHISDRYFPDKAVDTLDEMCARFSAEQKPLGRLQAAQTVAAQINSPVETVLPSEIHHADMVHAELLRLVVGQGHAVAAVTRAVRRAFSPLRDPCRPLACLVFGGPSSVGKTYVAEILSRCLYPATPVIRINLAEYAEKHSASRLFGAPPGYIGYGDANQLTDRIRRHPHAVVLFDNADKAHPEVLTALMEALDTGRVTDGQGNVADLRRAFIILTTVAGCLTPIRASLGFGAQSDAGDAVHEQLVTGCREIFGEEFTNRVDACIPFVPLGTADLRHVARLALEEIARRLQPAGREIRFDGRVIEHLVARAENARMVRGRVRAELEPVICDALENSPVKRVAIRVVGAELRADLEVQP